VVTAFVLIDAVVGAVPDLAERIAAIDGVAAVYSTAGRYDLIAKVRVRENEDLATVVAGGIDALPGIQDSETLIAFRAHSPEALDAVFSIGVDA
jgi:DNA-binding Lrp family transcriptional regulator